MSIPAYSSFRRAFPPRDRFRGVPLRSFLWGAVGAALFIALVLDFGLLVDLMATRGQITLAGDDRETVASLTGDLFANQLDPRAAPASEQDAFTLRGAGIFPSVWALRDTPLGRPLAALYRRVPGLRESSTALMTLLGFATLVGLIRALVLARSGNLAEEAAHAVAATLRRTIHRQSLRLDPADLSENAGSQALQMFLNETETVRRAVASTVARQARYPVKLALLLGLALLVHWRMTLMAIIPLLGCWWLVHKLRRKAERTRALSLTKAGAELDRLAESFRTTRLVRGYNMEAWEYECFQDRLGKYQASLLAAARGQRSVRWIARLLVVAGLLLVAFLAGSKVLDTPRDLPFATVALLTIAVGAMYGPLETLRLLDAAQEEGSLAADRIFRYTDRLPDVSQAVGAKFLQPLSRSLRFEEVSYALPRGRKLLDQVTLRIAARETIAVVSADPIEPRALASLIPRFADPQNGRILIDDEEISGVTLESLRAEAIWVSASDSWFTGTVFENLVCGAKNYTLAEVTAAAKTAHAHNFIQKLAQGYQTVLGQHGETLDAGQSYRLSLARAVLRNPALLIIEEPAEILDEDTKDLLDDAYNRILPDRTVILLPSRLSTVRRADRIVFLHKGRVEAVGDKTHLIRTSALYRHWEYVRFNEFRHEFEPAPAAS